MCYATMLRNHVYARKMAEIGIYDALLIRSLWDYVCKSPFRAFGKTGAHNHNVCTAPHSIERFSYYN